MTNNLYSYIIVRKDIKPIWQLVQASHAAQNCGLECRRKVLEPIHLVVLGADNEFELNMIAETLDYEEIKYSMFNESYCSLGNTALCTYPGPKLENSIVNKLELLSF